MNLEQKLQEDFTLTCIKNALTTGEKTQEATLTGGSIIDILEGREPKDYDFLYTLSLKETIESCPDFKYICVSNTSLTYLFQNKKVVQLLFRDINTFEYTISQATYTLNKGELKIDMTSFNQKVLIPTKAVLPQKTCSLSIFSQQSKQQDECSPYQIYDALRRVPHYTKKGYTLPDITYQTLLSKLYNSSKDSMNS